MQRLRAGGLSPTDMARNTGAHMSAASGSGRLKVGACGKLHDSQRHILFPSGMLTLVRLLWTSSCFTKPSQSVLPTPLERHTGTQCDRFPSFGSLELYYIVPACQVCLSRPVFLFPSASIVSPLVSLASLLRRPCKRNICVVLALCAVPWDLLCSHRQCKKVSP